MLACVGIQPSRSIILSSLDRLDINLVLCQLCHKVMAYLNINNIDNKYNMLTTLIHLCWIIYRRHTPFQAVVGGLVGWRKLWMKIFFKWSHWNWLRFFNGPLFYTVAICSLHRHSSVLGGHSRGNTTNLFMGTPSLYFHGMLLINSQKEHFHAVWDGTYIIPFTAVLLLFRIGSVLFLESWILECSIRAELPIIHSQWII